MKSGIELITEERQKQIDKHGFTGEHHAEHPEWYEDGQLLDAVFGMLINTPKLQFMIKPLNWDAEWWANMCQRPDLERLTIAGALIAAEIDRQNALEKCSS